jgi:hypothetical protein
VSGRVGIPISAQGGPQTLNGGPQFGAQAYDASGQYQLSRKVRVVDHQVRRAPHQGLTNGMDQLADFRESMRRVVELRLRSKVRL